MRLAFFLSIILLVSCSKSNEDVNVTPDPPTIDSGVYVAGFEWNGISNIARVWKDGVKTNLVDSAFNSFAESIFITDTAVYVAGITTTQATGMEHAVLWINGVQTVLGNGQAQSVFVSGSDVYVGGTELLNAGGIIPTVWKNGIPIRMPIDAGNSGYVESVFIHENDLYAAGFESTATGRKARLWKNSVPVFLSNSSPAAARCVYVHTNDSLYVSGYDNGTGTLWGSFWGNTNLYSNYEIYSIRGIGNNVYSAGIYGSRAAYSKLQLAPQYLSNNIDMGGADGIFVTNNDDVYVCGFEGNYAKAWKNGALLYTLSTSTVNANALSIFVR